MKRFFTVALISFCGLCISAHAANPKLGAVSPDVILKESKFAQTASKKISDEFAPRSVEITAQIETIKQKALALERDSPTLNEQQRLDRKKEIADLDRTIQKKQRDYQTDLETRKRAEIQTVLDLINKVVLRIAKDEKYDFILQNVVYSSPSANLTKQVILEMDKEAPQ
jgi:outer membrane protein